MTVAAIIARLIDAGTPPDVAAIAVTEAFAAGAACGKSGGIPVDEAAERRRAYDRDRKRLAAEIRRNSTETPQNSTTPLTVLSPPNSEVQGAAKKVRARKPAASPLSAEWQPSAAHFEAAAKRNIPRAAVLDKAEDMRLWARSNGAVKVDWDATFHGFLRRDASKLSATGSHHAKSGIIDAADRAIQNIIDQAADAGSGDSGAPPFRLISQG